MLLLFACYFFGYFGVGGIFLVGYGVGYVLTGLGTGDGFSISIWWVVVSLRYVR